MKITHSQIESEIFQFKVGRCEEENIDSKKLLDTILENKFDFVRLKIPASNELISNELVKLGFPFFFSGSIRRYKVNVPEFPVDPYVNKDVEFELYDGSQYNILREILIDTWLRYPLGYFRSPFLNQIIKKEQEIECVIKYYDKYNNYKTNPKNSIWFLKLKNEYVGFLALNIIDENVIESNIAGIHSKYQGMGLFHDVLRFIRNYSNERSIKWFYCGARSENVYSQRTFEKEYMTGYKVENVFHILSFLDSHNRNSLIIKFTQGDIEQPGLAILGRCMTHYGINKRENLSYKFQLLSALKSTSYQLQIDQPINTGEVKMLVPKLIDDKNQIIAFGMITFR